MEYTVKKPFRYRSRMITAGEAINLPRAYGLILLSKGKVEAGRPAAPRKERAPESHGENLRALRAAYETKVGRRPFYGWDASTLREKIAEA